MNISEHQILIDSRRVLNNVIYITIWKLTVKNNVSLVHIIIISVLITVNDCNAFRYLVH